MNVGGGKRGRPVDPWVFTPDQWPYRSSDRWPPAELVVDALSCPVGAVLYERITWGA